MASIASWILTVCGAATVLIGAFFVAARPPLLPEDARYMRTTVGAIVGVVPELSSWLRRVFWVLGGYVATTGLLVVYVSRTGAATGSAGTVAVLTVAGVTSIGWMSVVNFMIRSDFRWALLALDGLWMLGLVLAGLAF